MPSFPHEALLELFRRCPTLAPELLRNAFHLPMPPFEHVQIGDSNVTQVLPTERTADLVLLFSDGAPSQPTRALIIEVQLSVDPDKRWSWWWYLVGVHTRHRCHATLVVVTPSALVAAWAAEPISLGHPGAVLRPLVIGPAAVPIMRDAKKAAGAPELAILSAMVHGKGEAGDDLARAAFAAVSDLDAERAELYTDIAIVSLHAAARVIFEDLMANGTYEYQSDFAKRYVAKGKLEGRAEGKAEGTALAVLAVLTARGLDVPAALRERVLACTDLARLDTWLARAVTATSVESVVAD